MLSGPRVLEIGHFVEGPFATRILADLGADAIKVGPITGDIATSQLVNCADIRHRDLNSHEEPTREDAPWLADPHLEPAG